jgi:hypothetical protein
MAEIDRLRAERDKWIEYVTCDRAQLVLDLEAALARAEKVEAALQALCNFAWTAVTADCEEARINLNSNLERARAALATAADPAREPPAGGDDLELPIVRAGKIEIVTREEYDRLRAEAAQSLARAEKAERERDQHRLQWEASQRQWAVDRAALEDFSKGAAAAKP